MNITEEAITPAIAREYLGKNFNNRALRQRRVAMYAEQMRYGNWSLTHNGIAFDETGNLLDGQHRLAAVIKANTTVKMMVARGVARTGNIDNGLCRSTIDQNSMSGEFSESDWHLNQKILKTARLAIAMTQNTHQTISTTEINTFIDHYSDHLYCIGTVPNKRGWFNAATRVAMLSAELGGVDKETVLSWAQVVGSGFSSEDWQNSAIAFRNFVISNSESNTSLMRDKTVKLAQLSIQYFSQKKSVHTLREPKVFVYAIPE